MYKILQNTYRKTTQRNVQHQMSKWFSNGNTSSIVTEKQIRVILEKKFPGSESIQVEDVSGGCGAMFNIYIETNDFKGLSIPKQHKVVYDSLREQIKNIHGLHLETSIPK